MKQITKTSPRVWGASLGYSTSRSSSPDSSNGPDPEYRFAEQQRRRCDQLHRFPPDRFLGRLLILTPRRCVSYHRHAAVLRAVQACKQEHHPPRRLLQHRSDDDAGCHGIFLLVPLSFLGGEHYLTAFTPDQSHAFAIVAMKLYNLCYIVALAFFGCYDLLIGYLAFKSTFIPRLIGVLMIITGLGWLTFFIPPIAAKLLPYNASSQACSRRRDDPLAPRDGREL